MTNKCISELILCHFFSPLIETRQFRSFLPFFINSSSLSTNMFITFKLIYILLVSTSGVTNAVIIKS